jgi:sulfide:quinone oxidoreductase
VDGPKHVLIAGGGVAGLEAALALRALAEDRVSVEIVAPGPDFVYRPLAVAAPFGAGETHRFSLHALAQETGAELTEASVRAVRPERMTVETQDGGELPYDALLLALGARSVSSVPGAVPFRGPGDEDALAEVLREAREGRVRRLAFTMPAGISWPLPMYELVLLTAVHLADAGADVELIVATPEQQPLQMFGPSASQSVTEQLAMHGIHVWTDSVPSRVEEGFLRFVGTGDLEADCVVALPRIEGPRLPGVPHDSNGFVPTDAHARVRGLDGVYAAGDLTDFPVKQGGIATQEADAAAEAIAAWAGASIVPTPFAPVLRGLMLTGLTPRYMEAELGSLETQLDTEPLWWPPAKIVGRYLGPFLAHHLHLANTAP